VIEATAPSLRVQVPLAHELCLMSGLTQTARQGVQRVERQAILIAAEPTSGADLQRAPSVDAAVLCSGGHLE
jgi:hypothetical protein